MNCYKASTEIGDYKGTFAGGFFRLTCDVKLSDDENTIGLINFIEKTVHKRVISLLKTHYEAGDISNYANGYLINGMYFFCEENARNYTKENELDDCYIEQCELKFSGRWQGIKYLEMLARDYADLKAKDNITQPN
jgi:hypothetical protein